MTGWSAFGKTDIGLVRTRNEDAFAVDEDLGCFLVADGLGGHRGGDVASTMARDIVLDMLRGNRDALASDAPGVLARAVRVANSAILRASQSDPALAGMGTTLSLLWLAHAGKKGCVAQVGDSRVYRLDATGLVQITEDHTFAMDSVRAGVMTLEEAEASPAWDALTRAIGIDDEVDIDIAVTEAADTTAFLLCSDGLTGIIAAGDIDRLLREHKPDARAACEALVNSAVFGGGRDNVTVVVVYRQG